MEYEWEMMIILWAIDGLWWIAMDITIELLRWMGNDEYELAMAFVFGGLVR